MRAHRGPRKAADSEIDGASGERTATKPAALGQRRVAGGGRRWSDARRAHLAPSAGRGDLGQALRCATDREQRLRFTTARIDDDRHQVTAEAALRRQQYGLGQRRGDGGVVGIAPGAEGVDARQGGERRGGAHHRVAPAPGALLGHHGMGGAYRRHRESVTTALAVA